MKANINSADRVIRVILGLGLLAVLFFVDSGWRWAGLFGFVLLGTAGMSWCPVYAILGISTQKAAHASTE